MPYKKVKCKFCNDLQEWFEIDKQTKRKNEYFTTLVRQSTKKQNSRIISTVFPLIYCPVCGKKICFPEIKDGGE